MHLEALKEYCNDQNMKDRIGNINLEITGNTDKKDDEKDTEENNKKKRIKHKRRNERNTNKNKHQG